MHRLKTQEVKSWEEIEVYVEDAHQMLADADGRWM
jgi:hypothetical protein